MQDATQIVPDALSYVVDAQHSARLDPVVRQSIDDVVDVAHHDCAKAHNAGLNRAVDDETISTPGRQILLGLHQRIHFCVCYLTTTRIMLGTPPAHDHVVMHDNSSNGQFASLSSESGFFQSLCRDC